MKAKRSANPIDKSVGARVRMRRLMLGLSQEKLAHGLDLTFQQVQKHEKGTNRIGASRLQRIAEILQVPVSFFFQDLAAPGTKQQSAPSYVSDFLSSADGLALTKAFTSIRDKRLRRCIVELVEASAR
jgi:transcriptional regulator with XRE-family HTH domain